MDYRNRLVCMHHEHDAHCGHTHEQHNHPNHTHAALPLGKICCAGTCQHSEHQFHLAEQQLFNQIEPEEAATTKKKKRTLGTVSIGSFGLAA